MSEETTYETYVSDDSTGFLKFINESLKEYKATPDTVKLTCDTIAANNTTADFFRQQKLIGDYINDKTPYRGILIYWGLGTGKTGGAIRIAEGLQSRKVIWMVPTRGLYNDVYDQLMVLGDKSYRKPENYKKLSNEEKDTIDEEIRKKINERYTIMTYNSSKIINKLNSIGSKEEILTVETLLDKKVNYKEKNPLNNKLIIIDEVHNLLRQMIAEGSKSGSALFHMIMEAKNIKIVTMSGTPIADDPYNLAALFNMLRGYIRVGKEVYTLFPSDYKQFNNYFVDDEKNKIKNERVFAERISGLVSYYHGIYDESSELFPRSTDHIIKCVMSPFQQSGYNEVRKKEIGSERNSTNNKGIVLVLEHDKKPENPKDRKKEIMVKKKNNNAVQANAWKKPGRKGKISSYRMNSRQRCNFVFPDYLKRPKNMHLMSAEQKKEAILSTLNGMKPEDIDPNGNLRIYSEKMYQIVTRILAAKGPVLVYSQFIELEGLGILAKILWHQGYRLYNSADPNAPKFAYFTGKTKLKHKEILRQFNDPKNRDGSLLKVLFINVVGIEGLNLKGVREIHYMEEYWFEDRFKQVRGRGIRTCSHWHLPDEERHVDVYRYHSVPKNKEDLIAVVGEAETTDEYLYELGKIRTELSDSFLNVLKYAAFDCELNYEHNKSSLKTPCMKCYGDESMVRKMYPPDIKLHMMPGNSFGCVQTKTKKLRKFVFDGIDYLVDDETQKLYQKNKNNIVAEVGIVMPSGNIKLR